MSLRCVLDRVYKVKGQWYSYYQCDCGRRLYVRRSAVRYGNSSTCGCSKGEHHGLRKTREYNTWAHIVQRCTNHSNAAWADYGGRGIQVCERWRKSFSDFLTDVGRKPGPNYSIERIDNDGDYEPGNVRWATKKQQANNRRRRSCWKKRT